MELLVIRHGQSEADLLGRHEGRADYQLTELGIKQVELLSDWVSSKYPPDIILSSTLKRASTTAQILAKKLGTDIEYNENLMEYNNGLIAGLTFEEAKEKFPIPPDGKKPHHKLYEQESLIEFRTRAETVLSTIIHDYPQNKRIAIVSHGGMINMLFRCFMNLPVNTDSSISNGDTAVHLWKIDENGRRIVFLNSLEHLSSLE